MPDQSAQLTARSANGSLQLVMEGLIPDQSAINGVHGVPALQDKNVTETKTNTFGQF